MIKRLKKLSEIDNPKKIIPAVIEFVDIAGLVAGHQREKDLEINSWQILEKRMRLLM